MEKKESRKGQDIKNPTSNNRKLKNSTNRQKAEKALPWWVEFLFVQIGLPDKWLIKILKYRKSSLEFIKSEKRLIFMIFIFLVTLAYFNPVIKYSKKKLECESAAKNYIRENKNITKVNNKELRMLSTNFCNGGEEIYEIENKKK